MRHSFRKELARTRAARDTGTTKSECQQKTTEAAPIYLFWRLLERPFSYGQFRVSMACSQFLDFQAEWEL